MSDGYDTIVRNGLVVGQAGARVQDVAITDGRIAALLPPDAAAPAAEEIDASGLVVTPGGIDTHTHVRWPHDGIHTTDDFLSATRAAVLGGTTTIVDFVPPGDGDLLNRCRDRVDEAAAAAVVDFGFHPILTSADEATLKAIGAVIADGFTSFKMYTTYEDRRVDDGDAWYLMKAIAADGGLPGFHAENHELLKSVLEHEVQEGHLGVEHYPRSRPGLAEAESIQMIALYAKRLGTPAYIFHISGSEALDAVRAARAAGVQIFAETCTHYLTLDDSCFRRPDAWKYVISPPLRGASDREDLWAGVTQEAIVSVGSDHCAYLRDVKNVPSDDHRAIPAGAPGIEARTPLLFAGCVDRGLGYDAFAAVSGSRAAKVLGLQHKGVIAPGYDADLVIWDPDAEWHADLAVKASSNTFSLYDRTTTRGRPKHVLLRGTAAVRDGEFVGRAGAGRFIARPPRGEVGSSR
ncbi:amidohydrolase family protein [Micromonospora sp. DR5-3]|uniref:amidohydrolase family protein n=1 Tax=unclassified Micromonospora TaxID=2617518 RepID=UPI001CA310BA|nr:MULTISPECIES: amidohydrolase family protein [unclassified Micromonospora]MCW3815766.1 amidohydrolase family protein [Micromonospora sp. DR5-3]